jgi:23S rRNA (cytosine1962-C5)-methyltransferase
MIERTGTAGTAGTKPRRYQLNKEALSVVQSGHPWIFRKHVSSAAAAFADGQWLRLVDGKNQVVGYGFYQAVGAIGIRVLSRSGDAPRAPWVTAAIRKALAHRSELRETTDAYRAIHGESDGLPAVTADVYAGVAVISSYARGADPLARLAARLLRRELALSGVLWKPGSRRHGRASSMRVLFGTVPERIQIREHEHLMSVDPRGGQKSGSFLDLRGLRHFLRSLELEGKRTLDLFSYTGTLGAAAEAAGASEIWHVDSSRSALDFGREHHCLSPERHRFIEADVFEWLPLLSTTESFDLVVVDPPQMTSRALQVPGVLQAYDRLYRNVSRHLREGGLLVACCCTSRVDAETFRATVRGALGRDFRFVQRLAPEPDHPVGFGQADYLKILLFRRKARGALQLESAA